MKNRFLEAVSSLRRFHDDEQGIETINAVMLLAVAAMVVIVLITSGKEILNWMKGLIKQVTGNSSMG